MTKQELEFITLEIVAYAGDARSKYIQALDFANEGNFDEAEKLIKEASEFIDEAHKTQTKMIQMEASGESVDMSFLLAHAQDHLMTVMLLRDIVSNFIKIYKKIN
ncbi:PTS lactose/cellobiose transporter subunit IIA [Clostridium baratii]|uniref:PTS system lactose-specific transporter subunit IIA n=1 Tax=Clostridium baratii TaxID=1561 RepID=A0A174S235_9CLOT|nr:PTS lactose/cellobiose transporter subunit IIA [Clostridium baratii]CUP89678.1 PTS system lactose-specific transporter subunit IIA [Clostridium baratii]